MDFNEIIKLSREAEGLQSEIKALCELIMIYADEINDNTTEGIKTKLNELSILIEKKEREIKVLTAS